MGGWQYDAHILNLERLVDSVRSDIRDRRYQIASQLLLDIEIPCHHVIALGI